MKTLTWHGTTAVRQAALVLLVTSAGLSGSESPPGDTPPPRSTHWAFSPPTRSIIPQTANRAWPVNPIDSFVLARLETERLEPSPEADRITLLRRAHFDLTGLPPTIEEVDTFTAETTTNAYTSLVERLLSSPHYGERWGRHWLDAARYADSDGYEKDMSREVWPYRDYVIGAFNRDLPYDQFIIEQLAGDLLPDASQDQVVATGFLRNSMVNMEGAIDPEQFRMEAMFDRIDALGKSVLGLTVQCAQCHDHKYDPITQEEYFKLFAFINNDHEARPPVYSLAQSRQVDGLRRQMAEIEASLQAQQPDWRARMAAWEETVRQGQPEWTVIRDLYSEGDMAQRYEPLEDGSFRAQGYAPTKFTQWFRVTNQLHNLRAFRLELLTDHNLPFGGPGRSFQGLCALTEFFVEATDPTDASKKSKAKFVKASADYNQELRPLETNFDDRSTNNRVTGPIDLAIDGNALTAWGIDAGPGRRNEARKAVFVAETPVGFPNGTAWRIGLQQNHGGWNSDDHMNNNLGRFRLSVSDSAEVMADPLPKRVRDSFEVPPDQRGEADIAALFTYWRTTVPEWQEANANIERLWRQWPEPASSLTLQARQSPRPTHFLRRGDWLQPAHTVQAGFPAFLHPPPADNHGSRLTLARWVTDKRSPTTARVFVNRIWQAYFGFGLVATPEDFGRQSEPPSHPKLLDWLASEFMEPSLMTPGETTLAAPWSIKHLHRLVLHSATYRQSSRVTAEQLVTDPYNRLLARGARLRVEGEVVRDIALAASGLLNPKIGGPSVMPPAPDFLFKPPASYAPFPWINETGPEKYRRGLYTFRRRSTPFPMLQTFDVPNADSACVRRQRSNSPLQALVALNEPLFVECARALARTTLDRNASNDQERIVYAFRRVLSRTPDADEIQALEDLLKKQLARLAEGWVNPGEVAAGQPGIPPNLPEGVTPSQWAAYTVVARVLLNLDETITKE